MKPLRSLVVKIVYTQGKIERKNKRKNKRK